MSWNDNQGGGGGGPWGSGGNNNNGQNPWGQRPQGGGGPEGPDLDEVVRDMQRKIRGMFGGGGSGGKGGSGGSGGAGAFGFGLIVLILIGVWFIMPGSGWYQVNPSQAGVVLRFGEYDRTTGSGFHFKLPTPIESVIIEDVTATRTITIGQGSEGQMLTRDQNIVDIDFSVQWRVDPSENGVRNFLFNVRDPETTVAAVAQSAMREVIGTSDREFIFTVGRGEVSQRTRELLQSVLNDYQAGIQILQVNLQTAQAPASVIDAFRDVDAAEQDAEQAILQATAFANSTIPQARGEAAQLTQAAEAYRDSVIAEAQGQADRFVAIYEQYILAPEVTRRRMYLETMERVLGRSNLTILDADAGAVPYLPLNQLDAPRTQPRSQTGGNN
ncbi:FtsH protease activity modulator HflK [Maricaulis maris]|uniref:Protein HflK n=1 Tax=Maricaulis maris TaxID=74318 RepID=A0A495DFL0_9PROT|nr:FtsH protease activity modulator HflK [Maricaulis maris]RKR00234.1 protease FtsH subunit HflK [Maricaulis maris]